MKKKDIVGVLSLLPFIAIFLFLYYRGKDNKEYDVTTNQNEVTFGGSISKYNNPKKVTTNTKIEFQKNNVWFFDGENSEMGQSFIVGAGQTIRKDDSIITYLTGPLTNISRKETYDNVIKITSLKNGTRLISVCDYDSICLVYFVPAENGEPLSDYQKLFPDTTNHKYVDSIFDMNQTVFSAKDITRKYHKDYKP